MRKCAALVAIGLLGVPAVAMGQGGSRQSADLLFDERRPAHTTGVGLAIDYVNPSDPQAKPPAVQKVVIKHAPGSAIDTSVPARCGASNQQLMTSGAAACPAASKVGGGEIDLDTGFPHPARVLRNDVTMFNNKDELILLLESRSEPRSRIVARSAIEGATITTEVTPVPGGPPDGFLAIKRVRLRLEPRSTGSETSGRSYIATPASCPPERHWTNTVTFTYRDGVSQTVASSSPCTGSSTARRDHKAPRIRLGGVPRKRCAGSDFGARVRIAERWSGLRRAQLSLDGRRVLVTKRKRFSRRIRPARLRRLRHRLTVVALDNAGNRSVKGVRFRRCPR
jgi:hypothetical protein